MMDREGGEAVGNEEEAGAGDVLGPVVSGDVIPEE